LYFSFSSLENKKFSLCFDLPRQTLQPDHLAMLVESSNGSFLPPLQFDLTNDYYTFFYTEQFLVFLEY